MRNGSATKVAVSLPTDLFRAVERARKGATRSAVFQEALRLWLRRKEQAFLIGEYEAGYRRSPETKEEVRAAQAAALRVLSEEEW